MATTDTTAAGVTSGDVKARLNDPALLKRRYAAERRFQAYGLIALAIAMAFLVILFTSIITKGWSAFLQSYYTLEVQLPESEFKDSDGNITDRSIRLASYNNIARTALIETLGIEKPTRKQKREMREMFSRGIDLQIRQKIFDDRSVIGTTIPIDLIASGNVDSLLKGSIDRAVPEARRQLNDEQIAWIDKLVADGKLEKRFNWGIFQFGASSQPETAGLYVAVIGSFFMMLTVVLLAVPIGVAAAAYLEEFAPKNRFTDLIEVNINNLAAVPSIVFGLLGLAVFINFMGLPRSASLVGGLVLSLMTLPTVIIATRAAIRAVPPSIREAALGVGASKMQTLFHHVLPLALPGILTGTIIGLVQALGETAPLLMIGMVAFVVDAPSTPLEPATALPVQIYMWANEAERGFVERTMGATMVLLVFLFVMNATAVYLRRKFERKW